MNGRVKVLVVDDSALMRKLIPMILERDPDIEVVGTAMDGAFALRKIAELHPDVVTLDLEMPRMDGIETLRMIMRSAPLPVIVFSTHSKEGAYSTFKALAHGAIDFVAKPKDAAAGHLDPVAYQLIEKIKVAKRAGGPKSVPRVEAELPPPGKKRARTALPPNRVIAIGISTGGPNALQYLLSHGEIEKAPYRFRRIFRPHFWSFSTCQRALRTCSRTDWTNAAPWMYRKPNPAICSLPVVF